MASISEILETAVRCHEAGDLQAAEELYRQILATDSRNADAWHLLGVIASQLGRHDLAERHIRQAIGQNPAEAAFFSNLGNALLAQHKLAEARSSFRQALALKPDDAGTLYNLGIVFHNEHAYGAAEVCFREALRLAPEFVEAHNYLGSVLQAQKKAAEALGCYQRALELKPNFAEAYNNLGASLQDLGRAREAIDCFRNALRLKPDYAEAWSNLGNALRSEDEADEAAACCRRAIELKPEYAAAHNNLGNCLRDRSPPQEAIECYRRAIELDPGYAEAYFNLGNVFQKQDAYEDALACYRKAIALNTHHAEAYSCLGSLFDSRGQLTEATECYRRAAALADIPDNHYNLGTAFQSAGHVDEAIESYQRALQLRPDYAEAHNNLALLMLLKGEYERGWTEYEWRWEANKLSQTASTQPPWSGEPLAGRTILLSAEQGFGDTIQFVRYAADIKTQNPAATIIVACQPRLVRLLSGCPSIDRLVAQGDELPPFDVHLPFLSLPLIFKTTVATVPAKVPYLFIDPGLVEHWRQKLSVVSGVRIGINWRGRTTEGAHRKRDIPLSCFEAIAQNRGARLISLQNGAAREQLTKASHPLTVLDLGDDFDGQNGAFMDSAAVMLNLDLVVTSDTSVAHLAGALGVPAWLALPFVCDWRWLLDRRDTPWYPTMRLFRQTRPADWTPVFAEIQTALNGWMRSEGQINA